MAVTHPDVTTGLVCTNVHSYHLYGNNVWMFILIKYLLTYFLRVLLNKNIKEQGDCKGTF